LKFEQRGKELNESKKGIEEMVQHLKTQLDERDVTIQELQRGLQTRQAPASLGDKENVSCSPATPRNGVLEKRAATWLVKKSSVFFFFWKLSVRYHSQAESEGF
jgi:hypothetical protein